MIEYPLAIFPRGAVIVFVALLLGVPISLVAVVLGHAFVAFYLLPTAVLFVGVPVAVLAAAVVSVLNGVAVVGNDGILARYRHRATRFYPFGAIEKALPENGDRIAIVADGKVVFTFKTMQSNPVRLADDILARVEKARSSRDDVDRLGVLPPVDLGRASLGAGTYRIATPSRDELWTLLETGTSLPEAKILASQAIAATFVHGERDRLAVALATTLDPHVRVAFEDALEQDDGAAGTETAPARGDRPRTGGEGFTGG